MKISRTAARLLALPAALLACASAMVPAVAQSTSTMPELHWRMIGPFRGGRTRAAAGLPDQPNVFYVGQVNGGVWKSTDYGRTWNPIFDQEQTQSIGAIAVAPSDSKIMYVASGEGLHRPDLSVGDGIYRSQDGGATWTHLGLRDGQQIPAIAIDPQNPDRLFTAVMGHPYGANAERGIFRSDDGGKTWKKILFKGDRIGGSNVVIDPKNPKIVYASLWEETLGPWEDANGYAGTGGGLFKSTDGGDTWTQLKNGLPENLVQINVTVAASDPNRLYATLSTTAEAAYASGKGLGVYRSDDAGSTWRKITDDPRPSMKIGGGDLPVIVADPQNPDVVYSTSIVTCRSTDGGKTWSSLRGAPGGDDYQNLWINPRDPKILLLVSDQGAIISVNSGETWSSWYNQPTAQLYHVAATNTFPYQVCAGQQESGSVCISTRGNDGAITFRDWHPAGIIEYGYAAPDPLHPEIVYGAGRTEVSRYNSVTGEVQNITPIPLKGKFRADRTEPILFSPVDPHVLYYAANQLFKTSDYGHTWQIISPDLTREQTGQPSSLPPLPADQQSKRRGAIYSLAASYKNAQTLWAGTDDGLVWLTRDGGKHWANITPPEISAWSKIAQIDASRFDDQTAYIAVNRMRLDDMRPYAFRTRDGGKTWQAITSGLPQDETVNAVRADAQQKGLLFAATERGVYVSMDDGDAWQPLEYNLPHTSMRDVLVHDDDLIVATHGRSFWVLDDIAPLRELAAAAGKLQAHLFKPAPAWRVRRDNYTDTPLPADEPAGENPPDGAIFDYTLSKNARSVMLEVLDAGGSVIRRFSSTDPVTPSTDTLKSQLIPPYWPKVTGPMPVAAGMHRWIWDLRATSPTVTHSEYPISAVPHRTPLSPQGPLVLPGNYTIRLTVDGAVETALLTVEMDPRVHTSVTELQVLHKAETKMAFTLDEVSKADVEAHSVQEQLADPQNAQITAQLADYIKQLATLIAGHDSKGGDEQPGLDDISGEAAQIYGMLGQSDNAATAALLNSAAHVEKEAEKGADMWQKFVAKQVPAINSILRKGNRQEINLKRAPADMPIGGDEE